MQSFMASWVGAKIFLPRGLGQVRTLLRPMRNSSTHAGIQRKHTFTLT